MTVSEMVAEIMERATDEVDNVPMDDTEKLARKIAGLADGRGVLASAISPEELSEAERPLLTPAVVERAERYMQQASLKTAAKAAKVNDARAFPVLPKKEDGWYFDASAATPDVPEYGPYDTKKECEEARVSFMRSRREVEKNAAKNEAKAKARKGGTGAKRASEPKTAKTVTPQTDGNESEDTVKNDHPKKKGGKPAKAKGNGKPKARKLSALDAAYEVLKNRTVPMSAKELIEVMAERKLWVSAKGATPDATLAAALVREINGKGRESRFTKPEAGRFAAK